MLSNVLLIHVLRTALVVVGAAALLMTVIFGADAGIGVFAGGFLMVFDGAALVYLVGRLLDPGVSTPAKSVFTLVLVGKLTFVAGLLWAMLSVWGFDGLGVLLGMGAGLVALVLGLNRGSTSDAGLEAIREAEERIAEQMGDNEDQLR